jgi:hypothetical protein
MHDSAGSEIESVTSGSAKSRRDHASACGVVSSRQEIPDELCALDHFNTSNVEVSTGVSDQDLRGFSRGSNMF